MTKSKSKAASKSSSSAGGEEAKYVGCFSSETFFIDKKYEGGSTGANYNLALHHAKVCDILNSSMILSVNYILILG